MSSIPSWVRVGAKAVCIASVPWTKGRTLSWGKWLAGVVFGFPIFGGVYVITSVGYDKDDDGLMIQLRGWAGMWFNLSNFRPPVDEEALARDVAMFRNIATQKTPELVE